MNFDLEHFLTFCYKVRIPSKEGAWDEREKKHVQLVPLIPLPTQRYFLEEMQKGYNKGIRFFTCLKCRQSGVTTLGLALDLYQCFMLDGLVHNFIADESKVTNLNRSLCR